MPTPNNLPPEWLPDPITVTYRAIRTGLLAHRGFKDPLTSSVRGADVHFPDMSSTSFVKFKEQVAKGDLPLAALVQGPFRLTAFGRNSVSAEIEQSFDVWLTIDTLQILDLNNLKFNALVALSPLGDDLGLPRLVRDWNITNGSDDALGSNPFKFQAERYTSAFRIVTSMTLPRSVVASCFVPST